MVPVMALATALVMATVAALATVAAMVPAMVPARALATTAAVPADTVTATALALATVTATAKHNVQLKQSGPEWCRPAAKEDVMSQNRREEIWRKSDRGTDGQIDNGPVALALLEIADAVIGMTNQLARMQGPSSQTKTQTNRVEIPDGDGFIEINPTTITGLYSSPLDREKTVINRTGEHQTLSVRAPIAAVSAAIAKATGGE